MKRKLRAISILWALALFIAACGDEGAGDTSTTAFAPTTTTTAAEMPSTTEVEMGDTVLDVAAGNEDFSTLVAAVEAAGLEEALADPAATLTVFAPTNEAFEVALSALGLTAEELLADTETLTSILTHHVLGVAVTSADIADAGAAGVPVEPLSGEPLTVVVGEDGSVGFADQVAVVTVADVDASNGVIHVIDAVLLPPSMSS